MKSAMAITSEIDDPKTAAEELVSEIRGKLNLNSMSAGIVYSDADMDTAQLSDLLHRELNIDIIGLTTTATLERREGYCDMGAMLAVITDDGITVSSGSTGDLSGENFPEQIRAAYTAAREKLPEDPKLILVCAPYIADLTSENYMEILDEVSGGIPVFGGVATDHYDLQHQKTFFNGQSFSRGLVFLLIGGNVRPVFAMEHHFGAKIERKGIITQSSGHMVEKVGTQTFKEFVASFVPVPDEETVIYHFQSTPFVMELPDYTEEEQPVVRALCTIDHNTGAGGFLSKMPVGSMLSPNILQRDNLSVSCNRTLDRLLEQTKENSDYDYSLILICTCNARHLLMGDKKHMEAEIIQEKLEAHGKDLNAFGFYGFGEICPTGFSSEGRVKNRFHNISFALCAI